MESALTSFLNTLKSLRLWQILVLFFVLFGAAGGTYEVYGRTTAAPLVDIGENQQIIPVQYGDLVNKVSTSGNLVYPDREALDFGSAGTVESILVEEGERVLVLEAMKMETDVAAPRAGTVAEVRVKPGDAVAVGDVLLTIGG